MADKKSKISNKYLKRTAELIGGTTGEFFKKSMPTVWNLKGDLQSAGQDLAKEFDKNTSTILPKVRQFRKQIGLRNIRDWFLQQEDVYEETTTDSNINLDAEGLEDVMEPEEISESKAAANQISKAMIEATGKQVEAQVELAANQSHDIQSFAKVVKEGFERLDSVLTKLDEHLTENTGTLIEATVAANQENANDNLLTKGFRLEDYRKLISQQAKESRLGQYLPFVEMFLNGQWKEMFSPEAILELGFTKGIEKFAPKLQENLKGIDDAISDTILSGLIRLGGFASRPGEFDPLGILGETFGLRGNRRNISEYKAGVNTKAVAFNGITNEAITNTIPGYLRKILVQLGGPDVTYDYQSRSFRSEASIQSEFDRNTTNTYTLNRMGKYAAGVRTASGNETANLLYDLIMADLGANYNGDAQHTEIGKMANSEYVMTKIRSLLGDNTTYMEDHPEEVEGFANAFATMLLDVNARNKLSREVAVNEINRYNKGSRWMRKQLDYNMDLTGFSDTYESNKEAILRQHGVEIVDKSKYDEDNSESELASSNPEDEEYSFLYDTDYTNRALYEIYQRLDTGINTFVIGYQRGRKGVGAYKRMDALKPPGEYNSRPDSETREKTNKREGEEEQEAEEAGFPTRDEDSPNLLQNQQTEDGEMEDLTGAERLKRWSIFRGKELQSALFSGSRKDVKQAIGNITGDLGMVATPLLKQEGSKINEKFGNVSGHLKHKLFGTEYTYKDDDGNTHLVKGVENGGLAGYLKKKFDDAFGETKENSKNWLNSVIGYFDNGPNDPKDPNDKTKEKRRSLLITSAGALDGGILAGPLGLLAGTIAGAGLSLTAGDTLKNFLFGHDKETGKPTGVLSKTADAIVSPIQFQMGKTATALGAMTRKHVFGPLSDVGRSIHDRINNHVDGLISKAFKTIGKGINTAKEFVANSRVGRAAKAAKDWVGGKVKGAAKAVGSAISGALGGTAGKLLRGGLGAVGGIIGGGLRVASGLISGKNSFHKLKPGETYRLYLGERFLDPLNREYGAQVLGSGSIPNREPRTLEKEEDEDGNVVAYYLLLNGDDRNEFMPETKKYNKWHRMQREKEILADKRRSGYFGDDIGTKGRGLISALRGTFGGDYKKWKENKWKKNQEDRDQLMPEEQESATPEFELALREVYGEQAEKTTQEHTETIDRMDTIIDILRGDEGSEDDVDIAPEQSPESTPEAESAESDVSTAPPASDNEQEVEAEVSDVSIPKTSYSFDTGDVSTVSTGGDDSSYGEISYDTGLADISSKDTVEDNDSGPESSEIKDTTSSPETPAGDTAESSVVGEEEGVNRITNTIKETSEESDKKREEDGVSEAAIGSATQLAMSNDGITEKEEKETVAVMDEAEKNDSDKHSIFGHLKNLFNLQREGKQKSEESEEKKQGGFISSLFSGLGDWVKSNLPLLAGAAILLIKPLREWALKLVEELLPKIGNWLGKNLPGILKGAWELITDTAKDISEEAYEYMNDAQGEDDVVTGQHHSTRTSEQLADDYSEGYAWSNFKRTVTSPLAMIGDNAISNLFVSKIPGLNLKSGTETAVTAGQAYLAGFNATQGNIFQRIFGGAKAGLSQGVSNTKEMIATAGANLAINAAGSTSGALTSLGIRTVLLTNDEKAHAVLSGEYGYGQLGSYSMINGNYVNGAAIVGGTTANIITKIAFKSALSSTGLVAALGTSLGVPPVALALIIAAAADLFIVGISAFIGKCIREKERRENKEYAVRSNATKMYAVLANQVSYERAGMSNAMYVYCAQDTDRMFGLTELFFSENPEVLIGKLMAYITGAMSYKKQGTYTPGCEVLLYDIINNMAVQGVPFAVYVAGNSMEVSFKKDKDREKQCNAAYIGDMEVTKNLKVVQDTVKDHKDEILNDIHDNMMRLGYENIIWDWEDIEAAYDVGVKVTDFLRSAGILKNDGTINTGLFNNSNSAGWTKLVDKVKSIQDVQFYLQCLAYINSKINANKQQQQWVEVHKEDIEECTKRVYEKLGIDDTDLASYEASQRGLEDEDIIDSSGSGGGNDATEAGLVVNDPVDIKNIKNVPSEIRNSVDKFARAMTATYMYSHPDILQKWVNNVGEASGIENPDIRKDLKNWDSFTGMKRDKLVDGLRIAAENFAKQYGDIYNIIDKYDWTNERLIKDIKEHGAAHMLAGGILSLSGLPSIDELWERPNMTSEVDPDFMHQILTGSDEHGYNAENALEDEWLRPSFEDMGLLGQMGFTSTTYAKDLNQYFKKYGYDLNNLDQTSPDFDSVDFMDVYSTKVPKEFTNSLVPTIPAAATRTQAAAGSRNQARALQYNPDEVYFNPAGGPTEEDEVELSTSSSANEGVGEPSPNEDFSEPGLVTTPGVTGGFSDAYFAQKAEQELYGNYWNNMFGWAPRNPSQDEELESTEFLEEPEQVSEGGNPLNKDSHVTSGFGKRNLTGTVEGHKGIDLAPDDRSGEAEVGARFNGIVTAIKRDVPDSHSGLGVSSNTGGNYVFYETPDGKTIKNMHLKYNSIPSNIKEGAEVHVGDKLGDMGSTGRSTGPHLHYQIDDPNGSPVDPTPYYEGGSTLAQFRSGGEYQLDGYSSDSGSGSSGLFSSLFNFGNSDGSSGTGVLGTAISALTSIGRSVLNVITGGLFGEDSSSSNSELIDNLTTDSSGGSGSYMSSTGYTITEATITNVRDFLKMVGNEVGTYESPRGSNNVKYNTWWYNKAVSGDKYPWCLVFVQWCFNEAGLPLECHTAKCSEMVSWYNSNDPSHIWATSNGSTAPKPGDIAIFTNKSGEISHGGIIDKVNSATDIETIEGNTTFDNSNQDSNGGAVARKHRYANAGKSTNFAYFIRPVDWEALEAEAKAKAEAMANVSAGAEGMFQYLRSIGYTPEGAAGIVGSFEPESHNNPKRIEADYTKYFARWFGSKEAGYDRIIGDRTTTDNFVTQSLFKDYANSGTSIDQSAYVADGHYYPGLGYAQWTGPRGKKLLDYAASKGMKWYDPGLQLSYLNEELSNGYSAVKDDLMSATSASAAARRFAKGFENGNMPESDVQDRITAAVEVFKKYASKYDDQGNDISVERASDPGTGGPMPDEDISVISDNQSYGLDQTSNEPIEEPVGGSNEELSTRLNNPLNKDKSRSEVEEEMYMDEQVALEKEDDNDSVLVEPKIKTTKPKPMNTQLSSAGLNLPPVGGPLEEDIPADVPMEDSYSRQLPKPTVKFDSGSVTTKINNLPPVGGDIETPSRTTTIPTPEPQVPTTSNEIPSINDVITMMTRMLSTLEAIRGNTGDSSAWLETLNGKDFVDQQARDTLNAMKNIRRKETPNYTSQSSNIAYTLSKP